MRSINYYLIEPRSEAVSKFRTCGDIDFADDILLEPLLILNNEGDRSIWTQEDHVLRVKLLYLSRIREYKPLTSDLDACTWLGSDRINSDVFDKWWKIRKLEFEGSDKELKEFLKPVQKKILPTGNRLIDEWVLT